ncbi:MAG: metalloregulator ArsR/SmtB family transcription factor [Bacteroidota bacterium]|nr:metalloregulator ArsR/SmtB family transcription factor [Bacteroidota bacterium]
MKNLANVFKALSDESRLRIIHILLTSGELCVCDIETTMGFTQTKVSRHLAYLKKAELVTERRQGLWKLYSIAKSKNPEYKHVLDCVSEIVRLQPVAQKDAKLLTKNIKKGCCTTFSVVKQTSAAAFH